MNTLLRVVISFPALLFIVTGLRWVTDPSEAAAGLGMILLDGVGRGAQIGDVGALFFTMGVMILLAQVTAKRTWFYAPALMLYTVAVFRLLAWLFHGAELMPQAVVIEIVIGSLLLFASTRLGD